MRVQTSLEGENTLLYDEELSTYTEDIVACKCVNLKLPTNRHFKIKVKLSKGLCIPKYSFKVTKVEHVFWQINEPHVFIICVFKGSVSHNYHDHISPCKNFHVYLSFGDLNKHEFQVEPDDSQFVAIVLTKNRFLELFDSETWVKNDYFYNRVCNGKIMLLGDYEVPMDMKFFQLTEEITKCEWNGDFQRDLVFLKLKELFLYLHYQKQRVLENSVNFSRERLEKLRFSRAYLLGHYKTAPTIKELSRIVLLNESQLKRGFKKIYGKTIGRYVTDLRMEKALTLLENHQVNEIADLLGYKSVPHFISTFKKFYGESPKQFLQSAKEKE